MKKLFITITVLLAAVFNLSAGMWDSVTDAYNKVKDQVKDAGNSVDYYKRCDDKKNIEYFQKENTHLHETLYVSSVRGTNIKAEPSTKAQTLCVAPLNMPVRLLKVEKKETINNGESYWIKVYIPYYLQQMYKCGETGYIFGNYLSHDLVELKEVPQNWNKDSLKDFMMSGIWNNHTECYLFKMNGSYDKYTYANNKTVNGKWSVTDGSTLILDEKSISVVIKDAWDIMLDGSSFEKKYNTQFLDEGIMTEPAFYHVDKNGMNVSEFCNTYLGTPVQTDLIKLLGYSLKKTILDDELEADWRKEKGEQRTFHYEPLKFFPSEINSDKISDLKTVSTFDLDNDKENETVCYGIVNNALNFYVQKQNKYYEVKSKNTIEHNYVAYIYAGMANSLESPVPYIIIDTRLGNRSFIEVYTIRGPELKQVCKLEEAQSDMKIQYYFDLDNFYVNFYKYTDNKTLELVSSYILEQNVNDIYSFTQKKLKIKK